MRIAVWHNLPSGGGKRALYDQVVGLVSQGHEVAVWCPPTANQNFLPINKVAPERIVGLRTSLPEPKTRLGRRRRFAIETGQAMKRMEEHCRECANEINAGGFDVLLVHPCVAFRTSPIAQYCSIPAVLYLQEPLRELYEARPVLPWEAPEYSFRPSSPHYWNTLTRELLQLHGKRVQVREERKWASLYTRILVNSAFSRESLLRAYNLDSTVCYLGVDTDGFRPSGALKEAFVIGLGNICDNKRPLFAIECIAAMPQPIRPKLVWVGNSVDTLYLEQVQQRAREAGVHFSPQVLISDGDLRNLLSRAAVMIYTSLLEPFGFAPLEANACGTGVVAIAEGGVRETIVNQKNGILIPNLNAQAFAQQLAKFTDDLPFATEFGKRARRVVEDCWGAQPAADRLHAELSATLSNKPRHRIFSGGGS
jgi:glycosyltransferase involved in cell wall biosynthesis